MDAVGSYVFNLAVVFGVIGMILQGIFIFSEYKKSYVLSVIFKGLASLMFVIIGMIGYSCITKQCGEAEITFARLIKLGLIFGLFGDVCLNLRFVFKKLGDKIFLLGIVMFLTGHILYLAALIPGASNIWICIAVGAVLAGGLLAYIFKTMEVKLSFKIFGVVYLGAVIIMTCIAIGTAIATGASQSVVFAVGAVLFTASDIVLIFNTFGSSMKFSRRICNLSLYYIGQLLIAGSLFFF